MPDISIESATGTLLKNTNTDVRRAVSQAERATPPKEDAVRLAAEADERVADQQPSAESTREAVEKLQSYADQLRRDLEFSVDDSSGRTVVTVRDGSTEEVIRQIPSEEALRLAGNIDSGSVSLFDARA